MDQQKKSVKPFLEYDELINKLAKRGMILDSPLRAQRKLTQVGYYRLSGYWSPALKYKKNDEGVYEKLNEFRPNTSFESVFELYLFDKKLRLELTCAIERIEVFLRTIIAHELGRLDPLAHKIKRHFSKDSFAIRDGEKHSDFDQWHIKHDALLENSREDSIRSHLSSGKPIPIWVACEAWSFGTISKLYSMLNGSTQMLICEKIGIDNRKVLDNWLININGIRNRCAHHSRVFNRPNVRAFILPRTGYFNLLNLDQTALKKIYGIICVIWFLVSKIGKTSNWICRIADLIDSKPNVSGLTFASMGFSTDGFPRKLFPQITPPPSPIPRTLNQELKDFILTLDSFSQNELSHLKEDIADEDIEKVFDLAMRLEMAKAT